MLHHRDLAVNAQLEECAFFLSSPSNLKVRGTFVTEVFFRIATAATGRIVRIEFSPNAPPTPLVHGLGESGIQRLGPGERMWVEDVSVASARLDKAEILTQGAGKVVAPHGLVGQSFDGDNIAVDGRKDYYRELWWSQTSFKGREVLTEAQAEGAIEGSGEDYKVTDVFGTDFKYRRFGVVEAAPRNISLLSGSKRIAASAYDWRASKAGTSGDDMRPAATEAAPT